MEALHWEALLDGAEFLTAGSKTGLSWLPLDVPPQVDLPPVPLPLEMLANRHGIPQDGTSSTNCLTLIREK